jgi:predicted Holliday junction resolvase-like endonuclease
MLSFILDLMLAHPFGSTIFAGSIASFVYATWKDGKLDDRERSLKNEMAARERSLKDEMTSRERSLEDEMTSRERSLKNEMTTRESYLKNEMTTRENDVCRKLARSSTR